MTRGAVAYTPSFKSRRRKGLRRTSSSPAIPPSRLPAHGSDSGVLECFLATLTRNMNTSKPSSRAPDGRFNSTPPPAKAARPVICPGSAPERHRRAPRKTVERPNVELPSQVCRTGGASTRTPALAAHETAKSVRCSHSRGEPYARRSDSPCPSNSSAINAWKRRTADGTVCAEDRERQRTHAVATSLKWSSLQPRSCLPGRHGPATCGWTATSGDEAGILVKAGSST